MSQSGKSEEQSMEEILASIRSSVDAKASNSTANVLKPSEPPSRQDLSGQTLSADARHAPAAPMNQRSNGTRLSDALSQIAAGSNGSQTLPEPPPIAKPPASPATPALSSKQVDDLSDLYADGPSLKSVASDAGTHDSTSTLQADAADDAHTQSALGAQAQETAVPAPSANPIAALKVAPPREPNFDALKALEIGSPMEKPQAAPATGASSKPDGVLLPGLRDFAPSNPVTEMHAMAAAMSRKSSPLDNQAVNSSAATNSHAGLKPAGDAADKFGHVKSPVQSTTLSPSTETKRDLTRLEATISEGQTVSKPDADSAAANTAGAPTVSGARTLEDIVVDLLKPQLQTWLEANMPRIVERALRSEQIGKPDDGKSS